MSFLDFFKNTPLMVLVAIFAISLVLFLRGGIYMVLARDDQQKTQSAKRKIYFSLSVFGLFMVSSSVFILTSYFYRRGEAIFMPIASGDFPPSISAGVFPPAPEFTKIGDKYFSGLKQISEIDSWPSQRGIFAVVCMQKGGADSYKIMEFIFSSGGSRSSINGNTECWKEKCPVNSDIYFAFLPTPDEKYDYNKIVEIGTSLEELTKPLCLEE
jgi:hypothetical protein